MDTKNIAKIIGISRQHLEFTLKGKRSLSLSKAQRAVAILGGTLEVWLDRNLSGTRVVLFAIFMEKQKAGSDRSSGARRGRPRKETKKDG